MDNVHVVVRVRPLINTEKSSNEAIHWKVQDNTIFPLDSDGLKRYTFDRIFSPSCTSSDIFDEVAQPILDAVMAGYNGTIFAYGQTSSGKTHTMMGNQTDLGLIPRMANALFESIEQMPLRRFLLRVSYMEIYNEKVFDLLKLEKKHLNVREDCNGKTFVENLHEEFVGNCEDLLDIMKKGELNRSYGSTQANENSSRSHTIFTLTVESGTNQEDEEGVVMVSQLNLVDLAGSERASQSRSSGERFREGCAINTSLFTLRKVIKSLSQADGQFICFRDSKLTRILQSSIGGNAKTSIICTVTPAMIDETHSTLQFASTAKTIKNKPIVNEVLSDEALLKRYTKEIQVLQKKLETQNGTEKDKEIKEMELKLQETSQKNQLLEEQLYKLKERIVTSSLNSAPEEKEIIQNYRRLTWGGPNLHKMLAKRIPGDSTQTALSAISYRRNSIGDTCTTDVTEVFVPGNRVRFEEPFSEECLVVTRDAECQANLTSLATHADSNESEDLKLLVESLSDENARLANKILTLKYDLRSERASRILAEKYKSNDDTFQFLKEERSVQDEEIKNLIAKIASLTESLSKAEAQLKDADVQHSQEQTELKKVVCQLQQKIQNATKQFEAENVESQRELQKQLEIARKTIEKLTVDLKDSEIQYEHNHKHADVVKNELREQLQTAYDRIEYLEHHNGCMDVSKFEVHGAKGDSEKSPQELTLGEKEFSKLFNKLPDSRSGQDNHGIDYDSEMQIVQMEFQLHEAALLEKMAARESSIETLNHQVEEMASRHASVLREMGDLKMALEKARENKDILVTEQVEVRTNVPASLEEFDLKSWELKQTTMLKKIAKLEDVIANYKSTSIVSQHHSASENNDAVDYLGMHEKIDALQRVVEEFCQKERSYVAEHPFVQNPNLRQHEKDSLEYQQELQNKIEELRSIIVQFKQNEQHALCELEELKAELRNRTSLVASDDSTRTQRDAEETIIQQSGKIAEMKEAIREMKQKEKHLAEKLEKVEGLLRQDGATCTKDVEGELIEMRKKAELLEADIMEYKKREEAVSGQNQLECAALEADYCNKISDLGAKIEELTSHLATERNISAEAKLKASEAVEIEMKLKKCECEVLQAKLMRDQLTAEVNVLREDVRLVRGEAEEKAYRMSQTEQKLFESEHRNKEMTERLAAYAQSQDAHLEELARLGREQDLHRDCQNKIEKLQTEATECAQREKQLRHYTQTLEADMKSKSDGSFNRRELLDELNSIREREIRLRDILKQKEAKLKDMQQQVLRCEDMTDSLQQQLYELKNENDVLQTRLVELEEQESVLVGNIEAEKKLVVKLKSQIEQKTKEILKTVEMAEMCTSDLQAECEELKKEYQMLLLKQTCRDGNSVGVQCQLVRNPVMVKSVSTQVQMGTQAKVVSEGENIIKNVEVLQPMQSNKGIQCSLQTTPHAGPLYFTKGIQCVLLTEGTAAQSDNMESPNTLETSGTVDEMRNNGEEYAQLKAKLDAYEKDNVDLIHDVRKLRGTLHDHFENKRMMQDKLASMEENLEYMTGKCERLKTQIRRMTAEKNMSIVADVATRQEYNREETGDSQFFQHSGMSVITRDNMEELKTRYEQLLVKYEKCKKLLMKHTNHVQQRKNRTAEQSPLPGASNSTSSPVKTPVKKIIVPPNAAQHNAIENKPPEAKLPLGVQHGNVFLNSIKKETVKPMDPAEAAEIRRLFDNRNPFYTSQMENEEDNCKVN